MRGEDREDKIVLIGCDVKVELNADPGHKKHESDLKHSILGIFSRAA